MLFAENSRSILPEDPNWPYLDSPWDLLRDCQEYNSDAPNASTLLSACVLSHMLGFVSAYIFPIVGFFGVVSNLFITYIFLFVFRKPSRQMIYLACVAAADVITIILFGWIWMFPAKGLPYATGARVYFFIFNVNNYSCKVMRYLYSFSSCLSSSLFLLTAFDRCLCIYFPLKFARISRRRAWEAVGVITLFSALVMLPFGLLVEHGFSNGKIICWVQVEPNTLQIYHVLLANSSLLQTVLVIIINIALLIRLRQSAVLRETMSKCTSANREIAASMLLVILSTIVVICALPQSIAYIFSTILSQVLHGEAGRMAVRIAYNISDLGWQLLFFQQASNWVLYMKRMKNFRRATLRLLRCHCSMGRGLVDDAFGSIHYLSTKARNLTSELRFTRADASKANGIRFPTTKKGGISDLWKMKYSGGVIGTSFGSSRHQDRRGDNSNYNISEICRYTYRGSMRHTTTMSTITPGTVYADIDTPTEPTPDPGRSFTRF
ncbi:rhodopsin orphan GPCR [Echinococcus multilocularis]|uniref:Rhodopsin orphan GPCR n=1 Tax=Echinococcus multilocularis TaxID=6211 RepID=A0A068Y9D1_ECHMU|nr:rhodopsin orphan GPCR [Echinococcus multilocularis]